MKALFLTNEYPPNVYGGAGVHVEYLTKELSKLIDIDVRCFGTQNSSFPNLKVKGFDIDKNFLNLAPEKIKSPLGALLRCISFNAVPIDANIVHCHTWYSHFGGILAKILYGIPLIITTHSLEPLRPWKREQLGTGYDLSSWIEKTALELSDSIIAVSHETKNDILANFNIENNKIKVIPNGVDIDEYKPTTDKDALELYGIPKDLSFVLFVGRITRQKGIIHLLNAIKYIDKNFGIVLCAGAPDTDDIAKEMKIGVEKVKKMRNNVYWIDKMITKKEIIQFYSHAKVFCCPSIYEPFGIINLEAMACNTPVVGSNTGGIKEIIIHNETGLLVPFEQQMTTPFEPIYPDKFAQDIANSINILLRDDTLRNKMAEAGMKRVKDNYSWNAIAKKIYDLYKEIIK